MSSNPYGARLLLRSLVGSYDDYTVELADTARIAELRSLVGSYDDISGGLQAVTEAMLRSLVGSYDDRPRGARPARPSRCDPS